MLFSSSSYSLSITMTFCVSLLESWWGFGKYLFQKCSKHRFEKWPGIRWYWNRLSIGWSEAPSRKMAHIFLQLCDYHEVISNGWKRSNIYDSVTLASSKLPALNPFSYICSLVEIAPPMETLSLTFLFPKELDSYQWRVDDVSDGKSE